jgi:predicted restriction endonuclease
MISISFEKLAISQKYDRPYLAKLWGYDGHSGISRGVITPATNNKIIILFVTKEKQNTFTQYNDYIKGNLLYWEGEKKHGSDLKIASSKETNSKIYLFYRSIHHSPFIFYGEIFLKNFVQKYDKPSEFTFIISSLSEPNTLLDEIKEHDQEFRTLNDTEKDSIIKSRIGQGKFRKSLIEKWGACSVTNLSNLSLLKASHIKPWRACDNVERLDPNNGLLLHPSLDHLFDIGLITFDERGNIVISSLLSKVDLETLNVSSDMALSHISEITKEYLEYHQTHVFQS